MSLSHARFPIASYYALFRYVDPTDVPVVVEPPEQVAPTTAPSSPQQPTSAPATPTAPTAPTAPTTQMPTPSPIADDGKVNFLGFRIDATDQILIFGVGGCLLLLCLVCCSYRYRNVPPGKKYHKERQRLELVEREIERKSSQRWFH